jgi:2-polyprenyl-3-methyl-5-hydroxy-6-metoxy-1,4-benzoquinol methylase
VVKVIKNRKNIIKQIVKNKNVLDIGCIDHNVKKEKEPLWLHKLIIENSKSCLGVDIDKNSINILKNKGYNMIYQDAEKLNLNQEFDVIVAGELIEHLRNPGLFLESCKKHLKKNGNLVITTPNCFAFRYIIRIILFGFANPQKTHTHWYEIKTLEKMLCSHFDIKERYYTFDSVSWRYFIERLICLIHKVFAPTILIICVRKN